MSTRIKTGGNPNAWKAKMLKGKEPVRDSNSVLYFEPHKRFATKDFDFVRPCGDIEDVERNSLEYFVVDTLNESEARRAVSIANHNHLRKNQMLMVEADLAYRESLNRFNVCGNCLRPINVRNHKIQQGSDVSQLTDVDVMLADIPAHYRVFVHPTKANKFEYRLVPKTRIFNQKCGCGF